MAKNCYCDRNLVWWWFWIFGSGSDYVVSKIFESGSDSDTIEIFRSGSDYQSSISAQHWRAAQKGGPAGCTTGWASGLHIKAVWWVAEKDGPEGCPFLQSAPPFSAAQRTAFFVQPAGLPFCLVCSSPLKIQLFHLETLPDRPASPPISVIPYWYATCDVTVAHDQSAVGLVETK